MDYFERKLDSKNRLTIPKQLRTEFGDTVVVTPGFGKYLHLYPLVVWENDMEPALTGDILDENIADINVKFRSGKTTAKLDSKQGRVTLEAHQLDLLDNCNAIIAVRAGKYWRLTKKD